MGCGDFLGVGVCVWPWREEGATGGGVGIVSRILGNLGNLGSILFYFLLGGGGGRKGTEEGTDK